MDQQELQNKIAEYFGRLPADLQEKFSSMKWLETLKMLSTKYSLNDEQIQILGTETTLAILGVLHLGEYENILVKELNLSDEILQNLLADINDEIFRDVAPKLNEVFNKNNQPVEEKKSEESVMSPGLEKKLEELPTYVKEAVNASNYGEVLFKIAKGNGLSITETGDLEKITTDLIDGKVSPGTFKDRVKVTLRIEEEKANRIINEINEEILKKIRGNMMSATMPTKTTEKVVNTSSKGNEILKDAGIEILQSIPELKSGDLSQAKLAEPFKIPKAVTEYSLNNISKNSGDNKKSETSSVVQKPTNNSSKPPISYGKQDPYRMPIE